MLILAVASPIQICAAVAEKTIPVYLEIDDIGNFNPSKDCLDINFNIGSKDLNGSDFLIPLNISSPQSSYFSFDEQLDSENKTTLKYESKYPYTWNFDNFPFEHHKILFEIKIEKGSNKYSIVADNRNSKISKGLNNEWKVVGFKVSERQPSNSSATYSYIRGEIEIERSNQLVLWKELAPALAAIILAFLSYFIHLEQPTLMGPRFSTLVGAFFLVALSMKSTSSELGQLGDFNFCDQVYFLALIYILVSAFVAVVGRMLFEHEIISSLRLRIFSASSALASTVLITIVIVELYYRARSLGLSMNS